MQDETFDKKWSRDWENFDWKTVIEKCAGLQLSQETDCKEQYDLGITKEEFFEYVQWTQENAPDEYRFMILCLQLMERGMSQDELIYCLTDMDKLEQAITKIKEDK